MEKKIERKRVFLGNKKPAKMGPDYIIIIPRIYIQNGLVDPEKTYDIYLEEIKKKGEKED